MNEIIIKENGVRKCIERLNEKKACGPDKIPIKVLKQCGNELAPILTCIFKQSLSTGEVPLDWKHANVVPIPLIGKDGDDVIDKITCELTGTESINAQT